MSNIRFVVFHCGVDTLPIYFPFMEVGRKALAVTNPKARYVVLTDKETAPSLEKHFELEVVAPSGKPLMRQFLEAQIAYERSAEPGLVVLAGTDCVANRDLSDALQHNMAITYRLAGRSRINNVAYIEDHDRAAWFLRRALKLLKPEGEDWFGEQAAWEEALGPFANWTLLDSEGKQEAVRLAAPEGRWIHLYPCRSHNYFVKANGCLSDVAKRAFLLHYKGSSRKGNMVQSVNYYILREGDKPLKRSQLKERDEWGYTRSKLKSLPGWLKGDKILPFPEEDA